VLGIVADETSGIRPLGLRALRAVAKALWRVGDLDPAGRMMEKTMNHRTKSIRVHTRHARRIGRLPERPVGENRRVRMTLDPHWSSNSDGKCANLHLRNQWKG